MKKLAIIGKGTAGVLAAAHFNRWTDCEIELYYDENIAPQPVGEGSNVQLPASLSIDLGFNYENLVEIDGNFKYGIKKENWANGNTFTHFFAPPSIGYHFNAGKLQNYVVDKLKNDIKVINKNVTADEVDANFIMDCSGKPQSYEECNMSEFIPVNSVHVTQCFWDYPRFQYTLTIARPYGWVFGIPLQNRCSIGYMYNKDINTLEEVKEDVKQIFEQYNLTPSDVTNTFSFKNYTRKQNFTGRVVNNGNSSFFLEPLEATSIATMDVINRNAYDVWFENKPIEIANNKYTSFLDEVENVIMLHYFAGSAFDTPFWKYAQNKGAENMQKALRNDLFKQMVNLSQNDVRTFLNSTVKEYGTWPLASFKQNLEALDLYKKLKSKE